MMACVTTQFSGMSTDLVRQNLRMLATFKEGQKPVIQNNEKLLKENRWILRALRRHIEKAFHPDFIAELFNRSFKMISEGYNCSRKFSFHVHVLKEAKEMEELVKKSLPGLENLLKTYEAKSHFYKLLKVVHTASLKRLQAPSTKAPLIVKRVRKRPMLRRNKKDQKRMELCLRSWKKAQRPKLERSVSLASIGTRKPKKASKRILRFWKRLRRFKGKEFDHKKHLETLTEGVKHLPQGKRDIFLTDEEKNRVALIRRHSLSSFDLIVDQIQKQIQAKKMEFEAEESSSSDTEWDLD